METQTIHRKMAAILAEFPAVTKDRLQPQAKYNYRGIDDALRELNPLLSKHGVYLLLRELTPTVMDAGQTRSGNTQVRCVLTGTVRFVAGEDGSFVEASLVGEGIDTGDKAMMKAQANGLKYVLWYTFCVPTDEKKDSEAFDDPDLTGQLQESVNQAKAAKRTRRKTPPPTPAPEAAPVSGEGLTGRAKELVDLITGTASAEDLRNAGKEVRAWWEKQPKGDPTAAQVVAKFVAQQKELGA